MEDGGKSTSKGYYEEWPNQQYDSRKSNIKHTNTYNVSILFCLCNPTAYPATFNNI